MISQRFTTPMVRTAVRDGLRQHENILVLPQTRPQSWQQLTHAFNPSRSQDITNTG